MPPIHHHSKRRIKKSLTILLVFGSVAFFSSFVVILLNQDATIQSRVGSAAPPPKVGISKHNSTTKHTTNSTISIPIGVDHYFWRGRQARLVKLLKKTLKKHRRSNDTSTVNESPKIILNCTIRCKDLYDKLYLGTGNLVLGFFGMRLAAAVGGVDLLFQCIQTTSQAALQKRQGSILSWLQGYYPAPPNDQVYSPFDPPLPSWNDTARGMGHCPLHYAVEAIRHDLRHMAIQLVGKREGMQIDNDLNINASQQSILSNVELDDAAIHFRCGDVVRGFNSGNYGILQYDAYRQYISPTTTSIGIITTSFNESSLRSQDKGTARVCQVLVTGLQQYLQHAFPNAQVSIRNGPDETLALAYARLIMANQTFCSPSTFSIFPTIASFGTGYVQRANLTWFVSHISEKYNDVIMMDAPLLSAFDVGMFFGWIKNEWKRSTQMLSWLVSPFCTVQETNETVVRLNMTCGENATVTRSTNAAGVKSTIRGVINETKVQQKA